MLARVREGIPQGRTLPDEVWERRHRFVLLLLWIHAIAITTFSRLVGQTLTLSVTEGILLVMLGSLASWSGLSRTARAATASLGLLTSSALLVHLSGGFVEMHFHFFVMVVIISLYEDWLPFLIAIGFVIIHNGVVGSLAPTLVYNHPDAWANPWKWAVIYGIFVLGTSAACVANWRLAGTVKALQEQIDERKRAEAESARLRHENELVLNAAADGIVGLDRSGRATFVNPAAARMAGYEVAELVGRPIHEVLRHSKLDGSPCLRPDCPVFETLHDGVPRQVTDALFRRKDGGQFPVEFASTPIVEGGSVRGVVVTYQDVTERRAVERLKEEFISVVSHELRTPLTSIRGSLGLLSSGLLGTLPEQGQRMLEIAVNNTDRLVRLINDILDVERIDSGRLAMLKEACDAEALLTQAAEAMQPVAAGAGVMLTVSSARVELWADPDRVIQTLTNLLSNAVKFSAAGTTVHLSAERQGNEVVFRVEDQGRGIPADKLESIFERFHQVDASDSREKGGTGLGLAICRSIVQQHGGRIWAESVLERGSTFSFTLPMAATAPGAPPAHTDREPAAPLGAAAR